MSGAVRVLLTAVAHERYWNRFDRRGLEPLIFDGDGQIRVKGGLHIERDTADPEVAWGTSDLYFDGAPLRPYFGFLRRCAALRWFQSAGAGFDAPLFTELAGRGVRISNAHVNSRPIAEYILRAVLDHFQRADLWRADQTAAEWRTHDFREVHGSTWLIVGLGAIGSDIARLARAFGATTIGCRRHPSGEELVDRTVRPDELSGVIGLADVVVLAAAANASNRGLVDGSFLAAMKPRSVLVNVSRGSLVDEDALLAALDQGVPEAAILDVFRTEPLPVDHPLWRHPGVRVTAHNAAKGAGRYQRQADLFAQNLERYLAGRPLINDVTSEILAGA
jgi:phosphoglycerate dehydrogenase-like enzyme